MSAGRILIIVAVLVAGAATVSGAWFVVPMLTQDSGETAPQESTAPAKLPAPQVQAKADTQAKATAPKVEAQTDAGALKPKSGSDLGFDVVRVGPREPSVFAGRAPPDSTVSISANGKPVTTAKANEDGAWVALPEGEFRPGDYDITLEARVTRENKTETTSRSYKINVPQPAAADPKPQQVAAGKPVMRDPPRPRPITFVYDETTFTRDGEAAAAALADYVRDRGFAFVELSGHADERGTREHNNDLSRRRAETVAQYLRGKGYSGRFELMAMGATQPYGGIDRRVLSQDSLYQLDRRVELRVAQ